jgi:hypothetical protein
LEGRQGRGAKSMINQDETGCNKPKCIDKLPGNVDPGQTEFVTMMRTTVSDAVLNN